MDIVDYTYPYGTCSSDATMHVTVKDANGNVGVVKVGNPKSRYYNRFSYLLSGNVDGDAACTAVCSWLDRR